VPQSRNPTNDRGRLEIASSSIDIDVDAFAMTTEPQIRTKKKTTFLLNQLNVWKLRRFVLKKEMNCTDENVPILREMRHSMMREWKEDCCSRFQQQQQ
jgi:hypothetical protein